MPNGPLKAFSSAVLALVLVVIVLTGCSSPGGEASLGSPTTTAVPPNTLPVPVETTAPATTTTLVAAPDPCAVSALAVERGEGRSALGRGLYVFEVTNTTSTRCRMSGAPVVAVVDAQGRVLADAQPGPGRLLSARAASPVDLGPGASGWFGLESATVCGDGARPATSATIRVLPPGAGAGALTASVAIAVCPGQPVLVSPVRSSEAELVS